MKKDWTPTMELRFRGKEFHVGRDPHFIGRQPMITKVERTLQQKWERIVFQVSDDRNEVHKCEEFEWRDVPLVIE